MTGPENYLEAERLVESALAYADDGESGKAAVRMAAAQVHATLALAAATALQPASYALPRSHAAHRNEQLAWVAVAAATADGTTVDMAGLTTAMPKGGVL
jgi:hypothetical protein